MYPVMQEKNISKRTFFLIKFDFMIFLMNNFLAAPDFCIFHQNINLLFYQPVFYPLRVSPVGEIEVVSLYY